MGNISLRFAMQSFLVHAPLDGVSCENCRQSRRPLEVEGRFRDGHTGEVLVFAFDRDHDTSVEFPFEMDLADMPGGGHGRYRLVGILNDSHDTYSTLNNSDSREMSRARYYTEFAIDGHWYLIDGEVAYDLGDKPTSTNSKRVRQLFYERIEEANVSTTNTGSAVLEITTH
jgi:hypothetical protein